MTTDAGTPRRACCLVSELLEESGIDRRHARLLKQQVLQGLLLFCQWQLERMHDDGGAPRPPAGGARRARKVTVE
jgi:hypothetical protein